MRNNKLSQLISICAEIADCRFVCDQNLETAAAAVKDANTAKVNFIARALTRKGKANYGREQIFMVTW